MGRCCKENELLISLAEKYHKSSAQIILRWLLQRKIVVLPKSVHKDRIEENIDLFDFALTKEEMQLMNGLNLNQRTGPDPDNFDF